MTQNLYMKDIWMCSSIQLKSGASTNTKTENNNKHAYSEYKHVLANILRSRYVARTPPLEARSPGRRSNV